MIFGTTVKDKERAAQDRILEMILGRLEFAWLPTQLHDGKWVWLEHFYAYYRGGQNEYNKYFLFSTSPDSHQPYSRNSVERDDSLVCLVQRRNS